MKNKAEDNSSTKTQKTDDPLWNILGKASSSEPSDFFTRNVLREARNTEQEQSKTFSLSGIKSFLSPSISYRKLVVGSVAACACAMIAIQMWPSSSLDSNIVAVKEVENTTSIIPSNHTALSSFIVEETLIAAAENPSLFSHDEILEIINL